ncbi:MAG TPA: alpha/beta hydrolase [Phycisphaerales bacterium]|nr:alpha/beta hydrolase [Phycisphaerales bacterium]
MTPTPATNPTAAKPIGQGTTVPLVGMEGVPVTAGVVDVGSGVPVVFLHGLVGLNDHWEGVVAAVQHRCRCIMLEMPLLDLTGDDCSIQGATELTARFLRSYLNAPAVLVGNSFGGHVATRLAVEHPQLVRGLVLAGASGLIEKSMVSDVQIRPSREWLERKIGELFYDKSKMNMGDVDRAFGELSQRDKARAMVRLSRTARRNHMGDQLGSIKAPTLIIWGRQDIVTPPEACEQFHRRIAGSRVVWIDNCGHAPMIEAADVFAGALNEFLDAQ